MSQIINYTDDDLVSAIVTYWGNQGVTVNQNTAQQLAQEVRAKLKENTLDELKLALSEMKMELSPSTAGLREDAILAISALNGTNQIQNLIKNADFGNMARNEVEEFLAQLASAAERTGISIKQQRQLLAKDIHNKQRQLDRVEQRIKSYSAFNESSEADQKEILELVNNAALQQLTEKEHATLGGARASKEPESKKVGYSPEQILEINKAFSPFTQDKNGNKTPLFTKNLPTFSFGEQLQQGRSNERLLWTRKRFAYERALGRENSKLYAKRLVQYRTYINTMMYERLALTQSIASKQRLAIAAGNIAEQTKATEAIEHFHYDPEKGKNVDFLQLRKYLSSYLVQLKEKENAYLSSLKESSVTDAAVEEADKRIQDFMNALEADTLPEATPSRESELALFDPEYIFTEGRQGRESEEGEGSKFRQKSKLAPNDWSYKNLEQNVPEIAAKLAESPTTWKKGWAIFNWGDRLSDDTKTDVGTILRQKISPKITQMVQLSPYATDEEKSYIINNIDRFNRSGLTDASKMNMASGPWHWSILWNLSKDKISKKTFVSELLGPKSDYAALPDGTKALVSEIYKQYPKVNADEVRLAVANNETTPDWILMYIAQHDRQLETFALNKLGKRGWRVKKTPDGNPEISNGDWVWDRVKKASMILSYREAQTTQTAPAVPPQQFENLVLQQREMDKKQKELDKQRDEIQFRLEQMNTGLKQNPSQAKPAPQAGDTTNAIPGAITPPTMASGWKDMMSGWRKKIFGR